MFLPIGNSLLNFNCIFFSSSSAGCAHRILHEALSKKLSSTSSSSLIVSLSFRGTPKKWPAVDTIRDLRLSSTTIFVNSGNILSKTAVISWNERSRLRFHYEVSTKRRPNDRPCRVVIVQVVMTTLGQHKPAVSRFHVLAGSYFHILSSGWSNKGAIFYYKQTCEFGILKYWMDFVNVLKSAIFLISNYKIWNKEIKGFLWMLY